MNINVFSFPFDYSVRLVVMKTIVSSSQGPVEAAVHANLSSTTLERNRTRVILTELSLPVHINVNRRTWVTTLIQQ